MFVACWPVQRTKVGLMPFSVGAQPLHLLASTIEDLKFTLFFFFGRTNANISLTTQDSSFPVRGLGVGEPPVRSIPQLKQRHVLDSCCSNSVSNSSSHNSSRIDKGQANL